jgi:predicted DNA-binding protein
MYYKSYYTRRPAATRGGFVSERKDRLIQTRVPEELESSLKREARRQGTSVSQLVRDILEDALELVDNVVSDVDQIVNDSVALAREVARGARRMAGTPSDPLEGVEAWHEVVLHRDLQCTRCGAPLGKGEHAHTGVGSGSGAPRAWLCGRCFAEI